MAKAVYSEKNIKHFGLGSNNYTHFTSPIRRYPDLVVHRLLSELQKNLSKKRIIELRHRIPKICEIATHKERLAMEIERETLKIMKIEYMKKHIGDEFKAVISGVVRYGLFVEIIDLLVEGFVRLRDLNDDYYDFDEKNYALIGRRKKYRYRLGDKVKVKVERVDAEKHDIDFIII